MPTGIKEVLSFTHIIRYRTSESLICESEAKIFTMNLFQIFRFNQF